jgi:hypothetical protein
VFDYENTPMTTVLNEWTEKLLKGFGDNALKEKWAKKIADARVAFGH